MVKIDNEKLLLKIQKLESTVSDLKDNMKVNNQRLVSLQNAIIKYVENKIKFKQ